MNRLYVVETTPSNTGAIADHAWEVKPSDFDLTASRNRSSAMAQPSDIIGIKLDNAHRGSRPLVQDLQQHRGASIVLAGDNQPPDDSRARACDEQRAWVMLAKQFSIPIRSK